MKTITLYDKLTGHILHLLHGDDDFFAVNVTADEGTYDGAWNELTHYFHEGKPVERPEHDGITYDGVRFHNMPVGGVARVDGDEYMITEEELEFQFPLPGTYHITVIDFPYKDWTYEVTV